MRGHVGNVRKAIAHRARQSSLASPSPPATPTAPSPPARRLASLFRDAADRTPPSGRRGPPPGPGCAGHRAGGPRCPCPGASPLPPTPSLLRLRGSGCPPSACRPRPSGGEAPGSIAPPADTVLGDGEERPRVDDCAAGLAARPRPATNAPRVAVPAPLPVPDRLSSAPAARLGWECWARHALVAPLTPVPAGLPPPAPVMAGWPNGPADRRVAPPRRPASGAARPASTPRGPDPAIAFTVVLKESIRLARVLPAGEVPAAVEDLHLNLLGVPGAQASLALLDGVRDRDQLARFLLTAGQALISDAVAAQRALADWCADRQSASGAGHPTDALKPAMVASARAMMAAAPASTDWGLLGVSLAVALPSLPVAVRLGLQDASSCDSLWDHLVQAVFLAQSVDAVEVVRTTLAVHLAPAVAVPAWVALAVAGSASPPPGAGGGHRRHLVPSARLAPPSAPGPQPRGRLNALGRASRWRRGGLRPGVPGPWRSGTLPRTRLRRLGFGCTASVGARCRASWRRWRVPWGH